MKKLLSVILLLLASQAAFAASYSGCDDPNYIAYVEKRLSFYEHVNQEAYKAVLRELRVKTFEDMDRPEKRLFLHQNTILSARFDSKEVALRNIKASEALQSGFLFFKSTGDPAHQANIARGWLSLKEGDEESAIGYLLEAADNSGSAVLGSFGPDVTLIRELYRRGFNDAILEYLKRSESFWKIDSAKKYRRVWRKMIENGCLIQFQFYDTLSIKKLGFKLNDRQE